ncbi:MAG TPA: hypothetical protein DFR83_21725, partial [Deltaproteobacteria bacterium]|nr:hypothetical protein [Deltaproteobacteria bacterium]
MQRLSLISMCVLSAALLACGGLFGTDDATTSDDATDAPSEPSEAVDDDVAAHDPLPQDQAAAGRAVAVELCSIKGASFKADSTMGVFKSIAVDGERLMVATGDGKLHALAISHEDGCVLTPDPDFGDGGVMTFEKKVEWVSASQGTVVASNGVFESYVLRGNTLAYKCAADGYIELDSSGSWGIAPWVSSTVEKVTFDESACVATDWTLADLGDDTQRKGNFSSIHASVVIGDTVFIGGSLAKSVDAKETKVIGVYTAAGTEVRRFGGSDSLAGPETFGWIHAINQCKPGICILDSNLR